MNQTETEEFIRSVGERVAQAIEAHCKHVWPSKGDRYPCHRCAGSARVAREVTGVVDPDMILRGVA